MKLTENFEGYVVDIACLRKYSDQELLTRAQNHTKTCALKGHCMESGYGLVTDSGQKVLLESGVTPQVVEVIRKSTRQKGIRARVSRVEEKGEMKTILVQESTESSRAGSAPSPIHDHTRSPKEVLLNHLKEGKQGSVEDDLPRNFADDVIILSGYGVHRGHDGMRQVAKLLKEQLPNARFEYGTIQVENNVGFLEWTAESSQARVRDGADSYVIKNGKIVAQTIHYTVERL